MTGIDAVDGPTVGALTGGGLALAGTLVAVYYAQRNRRFDRQEQRAFQRDTAAASDAKIALDAWLAFSDRLTLEVQDLRERLDLMQKRVDECENETVPRLEKTILEQRKMLEKLERHDKAVDDLAARTSNLETENQKRTEPEI